MCYKKPGPRCSAHAAAVLEKARERGKITHSMDDYFRIRDAELQYEMTPRGQKELTERILLASLDDNEAIEFETELAERLFYAVQSRKFALAAINSEDRGDVLEESNHVIEQEEDPESLEERMAVALSDYIVHDYPTVAYYFNTREQRLGVIKAIISDLESNGELIPEADTPDEGYVYSSSRINNLFPEKYVYLRNSDIRQLRNRCADTVIQLQRFDLAMNNNEAQVVRVNDLRAGDFLTPNGDYIEKVETQADGRLTVTSKSVNGERVRRKLSPTVNVQIYRS